MLVQHGIGRVDDDVEKLLPANRISSFAKTMQGVSPDPVGPTASLNPFLGNNFQAFYPLQDNTDSYTIKGDHILTAKDNLSGRFTRTQFTNKQFGGRFGYPKIGTTDAAAAASPTPRFTRCSPAGIASGLPHC
jgi:hypothetical protein